MARRTVFLLVLLVALVAATPAVPVAAEHEPDHRYFVEGVVRSEAGSSLCGIVVRAADITAPAPDKNRTATTDGSGRYAIQLHLHSGALAGESSDEGHTIRVWLEATGDHRDVAATPNGENPEGWGQQTVDLVASAGTSSGPCTSDLAMWGGVAVVLVVLAVLGVRALRRPRAGRGATRSLTKVPGVGPTRARDLQEAGIRTAEDLAAADPDELAASTKMTRKQARALVRRAREYVGDAEP